MTNALDMKAEYKGYVVKWSDFRIGFEIYLGTDKAKKNVCKTLEECEKWIHKETKAVFTRVKIIARGFGWNDSWQEGEATSIADDGEVWAVSEKGGDRRKLKCENIVLDTADNRSLFAIIKEKQGIISLLRREVSEIYGSMTYLSTDMMVEVTDEP